MQAILTKFLGPTNHRGPRVVARCQAGRLTFTWDDALSADQNHDAVARGLAQKLGWGEDTHGRLVGGDLPNGTGNCYVFVRTERKP
jgi:hypothetical protein